MALRRINLNLIWVLLLLGLFACSREAENPTVAAPTEGPAATETMATSMPSPTPTAVPSATPEPTPLLPSIQVRTQILTEEGMLTIDSVSVPDDGWLAVYQEVDGEPGELLGYQALPAGTTSPLTVKIDARTASPLLIARLHKDGGTSGEYEYPGADLPFKVGTREVIATLEVDLQLPMPAIVVEDQDIARDGLVTIDSVFALEPGWLVIHALTDGDIGPAIGQVPVDVGQNEGLALAIRWQDASTKLIAILYEDKERPGGFDLQTDLPVIAEGVPVVDLFEVTLPPDILAFDQPIIEGKIIVDRAISNGPGWITAHFDEDGHPGLIIGFALLEDGINEQVEIEIVETAATPQLYLNLHEDSGNVGEFDFPAADLPVFYEGELFAPFIINTDPGNYLVSADQPLDEENQVIVPLIVADLDTWVVIYTVDEENGLGEIIGQTWLPAGVNRNIPVMLQADLVSKNLMAVLHQDGGTSEQFDYPGGVDIPLIRNLVLIQSPITILLPPESEQNIP